MGLKATLATLDGLSNDVKALYKSSGDGKFVLDIEGMVPKEKLDEFRNTNNQLLEDVKGLKTTVEKFAGVDPTKYKELIDKLQSTEEQKLIKEGKLDDVVNMRVMRMKEEHATQVQQLTKALEAAKTNETKAFGERDTYIIDNELRKTASNPDLGFQDGVADVLQYQVRQNFAYKDGQVVRVKPDGSIVFGTEGTKPATITEYLQEVAKTSTWLLKESKGGGAHNDKTNGTTNGGKKMKRSEWDATNPVAQGKLIKEGVTVVD